MYSKWGTCTHSIIAHSNGVSIVLEIKLSDNQTSFTIRSLSVWSQQSMWPLVFVTPYKKAVMDIIIIIIILTCDECLTWRWLCIPPGSQWEHGCGESCGCRRRGDRGKGDVGWRKLCWALIKACLGARANCCGFWHETGVEGSCLHDRCIL